MSYGTMVTMSDFKIGDIRARVEVTQLTPTIHWKDRHDLFLTIKRSRTIWKTMTQDQKDTVVEKVKGSLAVMVDTVEEWIPDAFRGDTYGETIRIELLFAMADVYSAVELKRESSTHRLSEAFADIQSIVESMDDDFDPSDPKRPPGAQ